MGLPHTRRWEWRHKELVMLNLWTTDVTGGPQHPGAWHSDTREWLTFYQLHLVTRSFDKDLSNTCPVPGAVVREREQWAGCCCSLCGDNRQVSSYVNNAEKGRRNGDERTCNQSVCPDDTETLSGRCHILWDHSTVRQASPLSLTSRQLGK